MFLKRDHLSTRELLLTVDRELPPRRLARARTHLAVCTLCQTRIRDIERTLAETTRLCCSDRPAPLPPSSGSRQRLKMRMAELSQQARPSLPSRFGRLAVACALLLLAGLGVQSLIDRTASDSSEAMGPESGVFLLPRADLTPGITQPITVSEVCGANRFGRTRPIPASVHQRVFQSYRADYRRAAEYELDHLITPELGGTQDARNLWPQPYSRTAWNAYVKDELELHFHRLICDGKLDFATAQREMATDWISAYKRYFKTEKPLRDYAASPLTERDSEFLLSELEEAGLLFQSDDVQRRLGTHAVTAPHIAGFFLPKVISSAFIGPAVLVLAHNAETSPTNMDSARTVRRSVATRDRRLISSREPTSVPTREPNYREPDI